MEESKTGRPTKFKPEYCKIAEVLCRLGAIDNDLAEAFDVNQDTINEWKKVHTNFSESLKVGKATPDSEIEAALFKRAKGYTRKIERATKDGTVMCDEELPPDPTSMIFYLKNRRPDRWRDKQEVEHKGDLIVNINRKPKADADGD